MSPKINTAVHHLLPRQRLEQRLQQTYRLLVYLEIQGRTTTNLIERERALTQIEEQWTSLTLNLERYTVLCRNLNEPWLPEVAEIPLLMRDVLLPAYSDTSAGLARQGQLESRVLEFVSFVDGAAWRERMERCERTVCRVEIGGEATGTAFLVARSIVITSRHVISPLLLNPSLRGSVRLRFDHQMSSGSREAHPGNEQELASSTRWYLAESPEDQLDYILLRLAGEPGRDRDIAGYNHESERGWLQPQPRPLERFEPLFILQHPGKHALKFTPGSVIGTESCPPRVLYSANTRGGSSGSPCFTGHWELVALHREGSQKGNIGVPFDAISDDLKRQGKAELLA